MLLIPSLSFRKSKFLKNNFPNAKIRYKRLGNFIINDVLLLKPTKSAKFVLKKYNNVFNLVKWTLLVSFTFYASHYTISGKHRAINEVKGLKWAQKVGSKFKLFSPRIHEMLDSSLILEYIDGIPIDKFNKYSYDEWFTHYKEIGKILYSVHSNDYSFGDFKAENIFYDSKQNKYYFIDFEQFYKDKSGEYQRKVWDVTELFFYIGHIFPSSKSHPFYKKTIFTFLTSYYEHLFKSKHFSNDVKFKMFQELGKLKYVIIYATFMSPKTYFFVLRTIQEWKQYFRASFT